MTDLTPQTIDKLMELAASGSNLKLPPGSDELCLVPAFLKVEDVSKYCPPKRIKLSVQLDSVESFCRYVNGFKDDGTALFTALAASGDKLVAVVTFVAILDYHLPGEPRYCQHVARFTPAITEDWRALSRLDGVDLGQVEFAEWLEDNAQMLAQPTGADLLELVSSLEAKADIRINQALKLQSGAVRFNYDEDVTLKGNSSTVSGSLELPREITFGVPLFEHGAPWLVKARLKYRIRERKLALRFELVRPDKILRGAHAGFIESVSQATGITPLLGR